MQLIKGAAVCGLTVAALVAGGSVAAPAWGTVRPAAERPPSAGWLVAGASTGQSPPRVVTEPGPARAAPLPEAAAADVALAAGVRTKNPSVPGWTADCRPMPPPRHRQLLDGFALGWVPPGIGPLVSDFEYEWDDVGFRSRVWESGPYPDESYRVDLQVTVMRSPSFTDAAALREFLVDYLERDPAGWATEPFAHPDGSGFTDVGELFWFAAPGVGVRVFGGGEQVDFRDLTRTACAVRQVLPMN
ncbi:hypothetical protein [Jiangella muralis]|uniref:hypothetical protein n=1 Tax=Jiangella muralis TaxID=702383 RepID=UPI00069D39C8|nr:hypothetical protein [Jiangella muralis]